MDLVQYVCSGNKQFIACSSLQDQPATASAKRAFLLALDPYKIVHVPISIKIIHQPVPVV
jgi:hypothetical protein